MKKEQLRKDLIEFVIIDLKTAYQWKEVKFNQSCFIRSLIGGDTANDWTPVTREQIEIVCGDMPNLYNFIFNP